jgi:hypothetical protein
MSDTEIHSKVRDFLLADEEPTQAQIDAMLAYPLKPEAVHLSLLTLRHTVGMTTVKLLKPSSEAIEKLKKTLEDQKPFLPAKALSTDRPVEAGYQIMLHGLKMMVKGVLKR